MGLPNLWNCIFLLIAKTGFSRLINTDVVCKLMIKLQFINISIWSCEIIINDDVLNLYIRSYKLNVLLMNMQIRGIH